MALSVRIDPIERKTAVDVRNDIDVQAQKKAIADYVESEIVKAQAKDAQVFGYLPPFTITVDGREGASLDSVNPDGGNIIVEFELVAGVLAWIAQTLLDRSPVLSGAYRKGHMLFADDTLVDAFGTVPMADEYVFTNSVPYARKIEVGKTESGRDFTIQVPNRIYERTANDARAKFGNQAKISFTFRPVMGGGIGAWAASPSALRHAARHGRRSHVTQWLTNQPAITVQLLSK